MYKAMFEPDLTRPFDNLTIMRSSDVNRVNKQEVYGGADVKADRVMRDELARKNGGDTPTPTPTPTPDPPTPTPTPTYTPLASEPANWATTYTQYYEKNDQDEYVSLSKYAEAPTFVANKYYSKSE